MIKLVLFVLFLAVAAAGFSYLADSPGALTVEWFGRHVETTAFVAAVGLVLVVVLAIAAFQLVRYLVAGPEAVQIFFRTRRRDRGIAAIRRGLVAVGAGDTRAALRSAEEAHRHLGEDPMALLLSSQAAQLAGDRAGATTTFRRMLAAPETRPLGLRGLYVEAQRAGDAAAARRYVDAAVDGRASIPWAANALLSFQAGARDWDGALETIRTNADNRLIDRAHGRRQRAVVLTAKAMELEGVDRARARALAQEAHGLAPDLVPAAVLAARLLAEAGEVKRATRVIETAWKQCPHPDLAEAYTHARIGDSARDRLKRARALFELSPHHPESRLAVAATALEARDFAEARRALASLEAPSRRACLLMSMVAEAEGHVGEAREWLARAARAPADPAWVADGFVSDRWLPMSPANARLDAFTWKAPIEAAPGAGIPLPAMPVIPDPIEVGAPAQLAPADPPIVPEAAPVSGEVLPPLRPGVVQPAAAATHIPEPAAEPVQNETVSFADSMARSSSEPATTPEPAPDTPATVAAAAPTDPAHPPAVEPAAAPAAEPAGAPAPKPAGNVVRLPIVPDDPGPEPQGEPVPAKPRRFGIF